MSTFKFGRSAPRKTYTMSSLLVMMLALIGSSQCYGSEGAHFRNPKLPQQIEKNDFFLTNEQCGSTEWDRIWQHTAIAALTDKKVVNILSVGGGRSLIFASDTVMNRKIEVAHLVIVDINSSILDKSRAADERLKGEKKATWTLSTIQVDLDDKESWQSLLTEGMIPPIDLVNFSNCRQIMMAPQEMSYPGAKLNDFLSFLMHNGLLAPDAVGIETVLHNKGGIFIRDKKAFARYYADCACPELLAIGFHPTNYYVYRITDLLDTAVGRHDETCMLDKSTDGRCIDPHFPLEWRACCNWDKNYLRPF